MFYKLLQFEWRYHSKQTSFFVFFLLFLGYGVLAIASGFQFLEISTMFNDAFNIHFLSGIVCLGTVFSCVFFCINGLLRDSSFGAEEMIFSTGIQKGHYFISRFLGIFFITLLVSSISLLGIFIGTFFASYNPDQLHSFTIIHYIWPWLTTILPNIFICTALLFSVTLLSRNAIVTYITGIFIIAISLGSQFYSNSPLVGGLVLSAPEILNTTALVDPLGLSAFFEQTQFLTPIEKNEQLRSFSGYFLGNRILWISIGTLFILGTYRLFSFRKVNERVKKEALISEHSKPITAYRPVNTYTTSLKSKITAFYALLKLDLKSTLASIPFIAIIVLWIVLLAFAMNYGINTTETYGSDYPTTDLFLGLILEILPVIGLLLIVFYSGELVWKTRNHKFHNILDSTPTSNSTFFFAKLVLLVIIPMLLIIVAIIVALGFQTYNGYNDFQIGLYLSIFYYGGAQLVCYSVFTLLVQSIISNKYLGMLISGFIILLFGPLSTSIGLEHPLLLFNNTPNMARAYSDFMGYGQYVTPFNWMTLYWSLLAIVFVIFSHKLWKRGTDTNFKTLFKATWNTKEKLLIGLFISLFIGVGSYIFYTTTVVNTYTVSDQEYDFNEHYERKYKKYDRLAVPQLVAVNTEVAIYPKENKYNLIAKNKIKNSSSKPMNEIFVTTPIPLTLLTIENATTVFHDSILGTYLFKLKNPLLPNQELKMEYELTNKVTGFEINNLLAKNGTYIRSRKNGPLMGYVNQLEIPYEYERQKRGLPPIKNPILNSDHLQTNTKFNFEKATFQTVISTTDNQIALSTGSLVKEWKANGRNYYSYKAEEKIDPLTAYFSANYIVKKVIHKGISIEVYYLENHYMNVAEMIKATKATIDYCTRNFGKYPRKYIRIVEMSKYGGSYGAAFPGMIAVNEMVFKKNSKDPASFNVVARLITHEVSHQWWGHLLNAKLIEGSRVFSESFAKYSEIVILAQLYNKTMVRRLSETTLRRYFSGRSYANKVEPPLYLSNSESYIIYSKGAIVMAAIADLIGENQLNSALKNLVSKYHHGSIATTLNLLEELYLVTPKEQHVLIDDWIKRVITYDLGITTATYKKRNDDRYEITVRVSASRFETNKNGHEDKIGINEPISIGIFQSHPKDINNKKDVLYLEPHHINKKEMEFKIIVEKRPSYISIDPYFTRLDKNTKNNTMLVSTL